MREMKLDDRRFLQASSQKSRGILPLCSLTHP
jgi:hypothetical protein